jgi:hypothetical protein
MTFCRRCCGSLVGLAFALDFTLGVSGVCYSRAWTLPLCNLACLLAAIERVVSSVLPV